jgi:hypothetical protein
MIPLTLPVIMALLATCFAYTPESMGQLAVFQGQTNTSIDEQGFDDNTFDTLAEKELKFEGLASTTANANEIGNYYVTTNTNARAIEGRQKAREVSTALINVNVIQQTAEYTAFHSYPSFPGFMTSSERADLDMLPELQDPGTGLPNWRAVSIWSDGTLGVRDPYWEPDAGVYRRPRGGPRVGFQGYGLDITNQAAVELMLNNISEIYDADCINPDDCIGPIFGYYMFSEANLSGLPAWLDSGIRSPNRSIQELIDISNGDPPQDDPTFHDIFVDIYYTKLFFKNTANRRNFGDLFPDKNPFISFKVPPKRWVPLFSENAVASFRQFAQAQGFPADIPLPADRNEFNYCGTEDWYNTTCIQPFPILPGESQPYIKFIKTVRDGWTQADKDHWRVWEDWIFEIWTDFIIKIAEHVSRAQEGNPYFKGCIMFEPPFECTFREGYQRTDIPGLGGVALADGYQYFYTIDQATQGNDLDILLDSEWIAGAIYETMSSPILADVCDNIDSDACETAYYNSDLFEHNFIGAAAVAKTVCEEKGKIFGVFIGTQYIKGPPGTPGQEAWMSPSAFNNRWDLTIDVMQPAIIFTIPGHKVVDKYNLPSEIQNDPLFNNVFPYIYDGVLENEFFSQLTDYRDNIAQFMLTEIPWHQKTTFGGSAQFQVEAVGGLDPGYSHTYQWEFSTSGDPDTYNPLQPDAEDLSGVLSPTLTINNVMANHFGWYRCCVQLVDNLNNPIKELNTAGALLTISGTIQDLFTNNGTDRLPGASLVGTTTEVGNLTWEGDAAAVFSSAGHITNVIDSLPRASVPYDPAFHGNQPITASAQVNLIGGLGDSWVSLGFMNGTRSVWEHGQLWMLIRRGGGYTVFAKYTNYKLGQGTVDLGGDYDSLKHVMMKYDPLENTVAVWINGNPMALTTSDLDTLDGGAGFVPAITHVGFTTHVVGTFSQADAFIFDDFEVSLPQPLLLYQATNPTPENLATDVDTNVDLGWTPGKYALFQHLYLGNSPNNLSHQFQGNAMDTSFDPGELGDYTTYYWRVDEVNYQGVMTGEVWSFTTALPLPGQAVEPQPPNLAEDVHVDADLSWTPGTFAAGHEVYFSKADTALIYQGTVTDPFFDPGRLDPRTDYHWRIDEVNATGLTTGLVWHFTSGRHLVDFDSDDDVDQEDFGYLQACFSGSDVPQNDPTCADAKLDGDDNVDHADFAIFQGCMSGPNIPVDPNCLQ